MGDSNGGFMGRCRSIDRFSITHRIGEGTYGTVYRAQDLDSGKVVALKRVKMEKVSDSEGFPLTVLREVQLLDCFAHDNIVSLKEVVVGSSRHKVYLVFEYCEHDLATLMDHMKGKFAESEIKCLLKQLLTAVCHLHENWVIHRDLKLSNLLLTSSGVLKLADFGLARPFSTSPRPYTPSVVTLWYRPPELLFGDTCYSSSLDMWAVGCIFAELWLHSPLLPGKSELQQVDLICRLLGTPSERIWPKFNELPNAKKIKLGYHPYSNLRAVVPNMDDTGFDLLQRLLAYDPSQRLSAREALRHPYFATFPLPKATHLMPTFPAFNLVKVSQREASPSSQGTSSSHNQQHKSGKRKRDDSSHAKHHFGKSARR